MKITFAKSTLPEKGMLVVLAADGPALSVSAQAVDARMDGALTRAVKLNRFKGKKGEILTLPVPTGTALDSLVLVGLGKTDAMSQQIAQEVGGAVQAALAKTGGKTAAVMVDEIDGVERNAWELAADLATGARLRSYGFDKYRSKDDDEKPKLGTVRILCVHESKARRAFRSQDKVSDGVFMTRDLVSEPSNVLYPETLAAEAKTLKDLGVKVEVLGEKEMRKLGMGSLLAVGRGSVRDSKLVVMQWNGAPKSRGKKAKPVAFVGKGVTFDTGGISLKPSAGMEDMKWDMGGSGVVIGLMKALAGRKAKANVVAVVGLVENMPSGDAQRPGDVVTSMSGKTIEVLNTDAEGRLVLADALWYCQDRFKPQFMVDLATLTGAIIVALGEDTAGLFSNNDKLSERLTAAGETVGEALWRMPMGDVYDKKLKSDIADMQNIGGGRAAGSITAAQFLQRFVNDVPWAHLDIAGVTWSKKDHPMAPKGGTGFGVRLLDRLIADHYEAK